MTEQGKALSVLSMNTLAFTACFAAWLMNGVLVTFLVDSRVFSWTPVQIGWLIGLPILTGSILRLPVGLLADRLGGRPVYAGVMLLSAAGCLYLSTARTLGEFALGSLGFGLAGTSFAVGIAYTSVWFSKERQGTALGVFGAGNAGSALTSLIAPLALGWLTGGGRNLEGWRGLPRLYAGLLFVMTVVFWLFTHPRKVAAARTRTLRGDLAVLGSLRVWRFGLYYFFVFGCFVALAQWLIPYYVSVYGASLATAGLLAAAFSFPCGAIRAAGGWISDRYGARKTMYGVLGCCVAGCFVLAVPPFEMTTPGESVVALGGGTVTSVSPSEVRVGGTRYALRTSGAGASLAAGAPDAAGVLPRAALRQEPVVRVGDTVVRKQLIARGTTHVAFRPSIWLFTAVVFVVGIAMGVGMAAVYRHIPDYFPTQVGVVGGLVGVIGGLGGFFGPILFGYLLGRTGIWTTCWVFLGFLALASLLWMHSVVRRIERSRLREMELAAGGERFAVRFAAASPGDAAGSTPASGP